MDPQSADRAERPRPVVDEAERVVARVAEVGIDPATGKPTEYVLDLDPAASEALFGPGMQHGVLTVAAEDVEEAKDGLRLVRNLAELKAAWARQKEE